MPRCINRNPRYSKHKASGQAVVTIECVDIYLGPWKSKASLAEYDRVIGEWLAAGRHLPGSAVPDITIAELIERYWNFAQEYYRDAFGNPTRELFPLKAALRPLNRLYGKTTARAFGPIALDSVRNLMIDLNWCRSTINMQVRRIKAMFKWAVARELLPASVHHGLIALNGLCRSRSRARESEPVGPVLEKVVNATLPHLSTVVAGMVQLQKLTGARPGEICSMRIGDIDRSGDIWVYSPPTHKTLHHGHHREIHIGPRAQIVLRPFLLKLDAEAYIFSPTVAVDEMRHLRSESRKTPLSCGNIPGSNVKRRPHRKPGERYDAAAYRRAIARGADLADLWAKGGVVIANTDRIIPQWHPHQLRHSAATEIRKRFGIEAAQHVLGHATLSVTEIYAEKNNEAARQVAELIG